MAIATQTMTDEQRKSVAIEYLKAFDKGGETSTGGSILDLFADDAQVYFPKWGVASGKEEIGRLFGDEAARDDEMFGEPARLIVADRELAGAFVEQHRHAEFDDDRQQQDRDDPPDQPDRQCGKAPGQHPVQRRSTGTFSI